MSIVSSLSISGFRDDLRATAKRLTSVFYRAFDEAESMSGFIWSSGIESLRDRADMNSIAKRIDRYHCLVHGPFIDLHIN